MPGRDGEFPVYYQLDVSTVACVAVKGAQQTTAVAIPAERFNQGQKDLCPSATSYRKFAGKFA